MVMAHERCMGASSVTHRAGVGADLGRLRTGTALSDLRALLRPRDPLSPGMAAVATAVTAVGAIVLVGWAFDWMPLKTLLLSSSATMKPNTALSFLLLGVGLRILGS